MKTMSTCFGYADVLAMNSGKNICEIRYEAKRDSVHTLVFELLKSHGMFCL